MLEFTVSHLGLIVGSAFIASALVFCSLFLRLFGVVIVLKNDPGIAAKKLVLLDDHETLMPGALTQRIADARRQRQLCILDRIDRAERLGIPREKRTVTGDRSARNPSRRDHRGRFTGNKRK